MNRFRIALVPALILLLTLLAIAYLWWQVVETNDDAQEQARQAATLRASQVVEVISGETSILLASIDHGLLQVRTAWLRNSADLSSIVETALASLPEGLVSHLSIVDADGYTVYSSVADRPRIYVGDREHFRNQQSVADRLLIGKPVQARLTQEWTFVVNRPILANRRFAGTVNIAIRTNAMAARIGQVSMNDRDLVGLLHADGSFLARSLDNPVAMGKSVLANRPFMGTDAPESGTYRQSGSLDHVARIYAWRRLPDHGLIAVMGLDEPGFLAPLVAAHKVDRGTTTLMTGLLLLAGLLLAGFNWRMQRQSQQLQADILWRQQFEAQLAQSHAQLEQRVAERTASLAEQSRRNALIANAAMDGFFIADMNGRMLDCNDIYCAMLGYSRDEFLMLHIPEIEAMESPEEVAQHISRVMDFGSDRFDTRHRRKDGSLVDVEVNVTLADGSAPRQFFAFVHDISARKRSETDLIAARDEAEAANAAKSEFLSRMSHELRTPLNAIIGFGQMLALPGKSSLTEQQADNVQEILKAGQHLLVQVNEVLDLARIESGRIELSLEPLSLAPLIMDCVAQVQPLAAARGIAISAQLDESMAIQGDDTRVKQVLLNLLSNAIKYNRDGGQVHVSAVVTGEQVRIEVRDTGRGIAPQKRERLFRPFERLESSYDGIEGTGIGLALVKQLVEAMGGEIGLNSEEGIGSTFWFALPVARLSALRESKVGVCGTAPAVTVVPSPGQTPRRVLYIEDNPANLKLIRKIIGLRPGFALLDAMDAELGLEIARREQPDLILLDINLPGMDGFAAIAQLQAWPETAAIPVVAVTANAMKHDVDRGKSAGFADYLTKPIDIAHLHHILDTLSARKRA